MKSFLTLICCCLAAVFAQAQCSVSVSADRDTLTCQSSVATLTATPSGGTAPYSYAWSPNISSGGATAHITNTGIYTVTITDAMGCTATQTMNVPMNYGNIYTVPITLSQTAQCDGVKICLVNAPSNWTMTLNDPNLSGGGWGTSSNVTGTCVTMKTAGSYYVTVTDTQTGCTRTNYTVINNVPYTDNIKMQMMQKPSTCTSQDGIAKIDITNQTQSYTMLWSDGITTAINNTLKKSTNYMVTVTGSTGCTASFGLNFSPLSQKTANDLHIDKEPSNCWADNRGFANAFFLPEIKNLSYHWSNGSSGTTYYPPNYSITNETQGNYVAGLQSGLYNVTISDGCTSFNRSFYISQKCGPAISGKLVFDSNNNCAYDTTDILTHQGFLRIKNIQTQQYSFYGSNFDGSYLATVVDTGYYEISYLPSYTDCGHYTVGCVIPNIHVSNSSLNYTDNNLYLQPTGSSGADLTTYTYQERARPVTPQKFDMYCFNNGIAIANNVVLNFSHDSLWSNLTQLNGSILPSNSTASTKTWNIGTMNPNSFQKISFTMELPQNATIGTLLNYTVAVNSTNADCSPSNNIYSWSNNVTNSFDPNDKTLLNPHDEQGGILIDGAPLRYQIRFQNTGTDTAYTVVIRDTIDLTHLDKSTFKIIGASHNMQTRWEGANILVFEFPNIYLVDSFHNEPKSHGWLQFSITPKTNTPLYSNIKNTAAIFFDYNDAVITNTVSTTFVPYLSTETITVSSPIALQITPNPTTDVIYVKHNEIGIITVTDILGRTLLYQNSNGQNTIIDLATQAAGTYFVHLQTEKGSVTNKVIKVK